MFSDVSIVVACSAGLCGGVSMLVIGNRYTRNLRVLGWGGVVSGVAVAGLSFLVARWCLHGFEPMQTWLLPPACLMLLLVMAAQNWFVFYEDHEDAAQSARPTLAVLAAAIASMIAAWFGDERTAVLQAIWAGAISLAILLSIRPVFRSIAVNRSVPVGILVGVCKLLVPSTGIVVFVLAGMLSRVRLAARAKDRTAAKDRAPAAADAARMGASALQTPAADARCNDDPAGQSIGVNLLLLLWEIGWLPLLTLVNGARVIRPPAMTDPADLLYRQKGAGSVAGQMPRAARDTVVLILVLAAHVLCGVVIARD